MFPRLIRSSSSALLVFSLSVFPGLVRAGQVEAAHAWSYEGQHGPGHWGDLNPEYAACRMGTHQSPIDIRNAKAADLPAIEFSYLRAPFRIIDNGHTVQVSLDPGSYIAVGGRRYDLVQFHFHHPSEERIHGHAYPMVAHLVHKDADGKLAVVAVLMKTGHANQLIEKLWKSMPADVGQEHAPQGALVDLNQLLPASRGYYSFTGSLTTPPCTEDVTWFVLKDQAQISQDELAKFAAKYPHNARPVQPLNGRELRATK